jgi:hypothetical protein
LVTYLLIALAFVAVLVALRLFLLKPRERPADWRSMFESDARASLRSLLADPASAEGRAAEARGDWTSARAAYSRALESVREGDREDPGRALKLRALESKLEEIHRRLGDDR